MSHSINVARKVDIFNSMPHKEASPSHENYYNPDCLGPKGRQDTREVDTSLLFYLEYWQGYSGVF